MTFEYNYNYRLVTNYSKNIHVPRIVESEALFVEESSEREEKRSAAAMNQCSLASFDLSLHLIPFRIPIPIPIHLSIHPSILSQKKMGNKRAE